ncbi:MAG: ATP-binding cassette domain-containing protein [Dysgonamonadaceae bacterium]
MQHHTLEIGNVQLSFGERTILRSVYIKSETGRVTGILGRNGCGKSCLLKLIFGSFPGIERAVRMNGNILSGCKRKTEDMRMLPQFDFLPR